MADAFISSLAAAATLTGSELLETSQLSSTVTKTATTISAQASDNSFNDSGSGFIAAGFAVDDRVRVTGFTGNVVNNIVAGKITALTAGKMTIGGTDGDVVVDDAAGESVTISKWLSRRTTAQNIANLVGSAVTVIGARLEKTTQALSAGVEAAMTFTSELRDDGNWHDNSTNTSRITVGVTGWYIVTAYADFDTVSGTKLLRLRLNGTGGFSGSTMTGVTDFRVSTVSLLYLSASDYIEGLVYSSTACSLDVGGLSAVLLAGIASAPANQVVTILVSDPAGSAIATGDGKAYFPVPSTLNGLNLVSAKAFLTTTSSSGIPTIQIANVTQAADMLTTKLTIDASELTSATAATPVVIDTANDDVATGDMLRIDIDVAGTGAKGLIVEMQFA